MKAKRILAIIAILLLAGMYLLSLIFAIIDHPLKSSLMSASLYCTVIIPILLYVFLFITKLIRQNSESNEE